MASKAFDEPVNIKYKGFDANKHALEMVSYGESLSGVGKIISVTGNFLATGRYIRRQDCLDVRTLAGIPRRGSVELMPIIEYIGQYNLLSESTALLSSIVALVVFVRSRQDSESRRQQEKIIKQLSKRIKKDAKTIDKMVGIIERMPTDMRVPLIRAVAPVGQSCQTMQVGKTIYGGIPIDSYMKEQILSEEPLEIFPPENFTIKISEIDLITKSCKFSFIDSPGKRVKAQILDSSITRKKNKYLISLSEGTSLNVQASAAFRNGELEKLLITNA